METIYEKIKDAIINEVCNVRCSGCYEVGVCPDHDCKAWKILTDVCNEACKVKPT